MGWGEKFRGIFSGGKKTTEQESAPEQPKKIELKLGNFNIGELDIPDQVLTFPGGGAISLDAPALGPLLCKQEPNTITLYYTNAPEAGVIFEKLSDPNSIDVYASIPSTFTGSGVCSSPEMIYDILLPFCRAALAVKPKEAATPDASAPPPPETTKPEPVAKSEPPKTARKKGKISAPITTPPRMRINLTPDVKNRRKKSLTDTVIGAVRNAPDAITAEAKDVAAGFKSFADTAKIGARMAVLGAKESAKQAATAAVASTKRAVREVKERREARRPEKRLAEGQALDAVGALKDGELSGWRKDRHQTEPKRPQGKTLARWKENWGRRLGGDWFRREEFRQGEVEYFLYLLEAPPTAAELFPGVKPLLPKHTFENLRSPADPREPATDREKYERWEEVRKARWADYFKTIEKDPKRGPQVALRLRLYFSNPEVGDLRRYLPPLPPPPPPPDLADLAMRAARQLSGKDLAQFQEIAGIFASTPRPTTGDTYHLPDQSEIDDRIDEYLATHRTSRQLRDFLELAHPSARARVARANRPPRTAPPEHLDPHPNAPTTLRDQLNIIDQATDALRGDDQRLLKQLVVIANSPDATEEEIEHGLRTRLEVEGQNRFNNIENYILHATRQHPLFEQLARIGRVLVEMAGREAPLDDEETPPLPPPPGTVAEELGVPISKDLPPPPAPPRAPAPRTPPAPRASGAPPEPSREPPRTSEPPEPPAPEKDPREDELFDTAWDLVASTKNASVSMLQRRLGIGYNRAARLIEQFERDRLIGPYQGARGREVFSDTPKPTKSETPATPALLDVHKIANDDEAIVGEKKAPPIPPRPRRPETKPPVDLEIEGENLGTFDIENEAFVSTTGERVSLHSDILGPVELTRYSDNYSLRYPIIPRTGDRISIAKGSDDKKAKITVMVGGSYPALVQDTDGADIALKIKEFIPQAEANYRAVANWWQGNRALQSCLEKVKHISEGSPSTGIGTVNKAVIDYLVGLDINLSALKIEYPNLAASIDDFVDSDTYKETREASRILYQRRLQRLEKEFHDLKAVLTPENQSNGRIADLVTRISEKIESINKELAPDSLWFPMPYKFASLEDEINRLRSLLRPL